MNSARTSAPAVPRPAVHADLEARGGRGALAVVTGAAGFIGTHLVRDLLARGWSVRSLDLHGPAADGAPGGVDFVAGDIRDASLVREVVAGADTVFHLASAHLQVNAPTGWYESVNVDAVATLVEACAAAGVRRLVHTSSVGIYGHVQSPPANEDSPKRPESAYEITKLEGEMVALRAAARLGLDLIVLRPGWVYGPGCPRTEKLLRTIRRGRFVFIGDGSNLRHPIDVSDAVEAFARAAAAPSAASGRPYLIVGPSVVTVRELVTVCARVLGVRVPSIQLRRPAGVALARGCEWVFGALGRQPPFSRRSLAFFDNDNAFDGRAAGEHLAFCAGVELEDGLGRVVAALGGGTAEGRS